LIAFQNLLFTAKVEQAIESIASFDVNAAAFVYTPIFVIFRSSFGFHLKLP